MAPRHDTQLEKVIDDVLKSGDVQALDRLLQRNVYGGAPIKCSAQFLPKLDKLVSRSLDQKDSKSAGLGLAILYKRGKHLKLPGGCQGLSGFIAQGLLKKWFGKCRHLWIECGPQWDETLFNLSEDFFDALMVVHEAGKEGTCKITESFLYPVGQLAVDPRIYILIQKEAIRKFNLILDKIPVELKKEKKILTSQEASDIMMKLAGKILKGGDYDLQTALMEALCRMATPNQRKELADRWFSMEHVASALVKIKDSEFETDCRKFLNLVNGMQGDGRRVYSYPCLEVCLDKHELLMPADEKLEEFWIDFNLDSHSISFYFSLSDGETQEGQWETLCINENEVQSYTVTEEGKMKVLQLLLSEVMVVGEIEGSSLTIHFSSSLDILQAARNVYGHCKNKGFVGKMGKSVVKTTVRIIMEDKISQVVPESQMSVGESEKDTAPYLLPAQSAVVQMVTPNRMRVSESTTIISGSEGRSVHGASSLSAVLSSAKGKGKPSLEMVRSCDKQGELYLGALRTSAKTGSNGTPNSPMAGDMTEQGATPLQSMASKQSNRKKLGKYKKNITVAEAVDMVLSGHGEEPSLESSAVPDTQPRTERNITFNWNKISVSEMIMMPTQKINSLTRPEPLPSLAQQQECPSSAQRVSFPGSSSTSQKQLHSELTQRLQKVLRERNQDPAPQEPFAPQRKLSDLSEDSKGRSSVFPCAAVLCTPKEQQTQRKALAKGKSKCLMSVEADAAVIKDPAKTSTTKALQKKVPPHVEVETNNGRSNKEKRDAEVAGSLVKLISSHYEINTQSTVKDTAEIVPKTWIPPLVNRPIFNMSWLSTAKKEKSGAVSLIKSYSKTTTNSTKQRKDIFAFDIDTPLSVTGKNKTLSHTSAKSSRLFDSGIHDSSELPSTTKKGQPVAKAKRYVKKHLFSDTDYSTTDVSWLRESSRKPKPKVTKYSSQAPVKPRAMSPHTSYDSPDLHPASRIPVKGNKLNKKKLDVKGSVEQPNKAVKLAPAPNRLHAASRRSQRRAALSTKSYREPGTDDSLSETEKPAVPKYSSANHFENAERTHEAAQVTKKKKASKRPTKSKMIPESNHHSSQSESMFGQPPTSKQQRPENVLSETWKLNKENVVPAQEEVNRLKDPWAARQTFFCPSPPLIERMRSAERSAPTLGLTCSPLLTPRGSPLPASPDSLCEDTPSPILLLPKPRSTVSSKGHFRPSFYSAEKKRSSKTRSNQSVPSLPSLTPIGQTPASAAPPGPRAAEINPIKELLPSAPQSPFTLSSRPLLTSTLLELDKPSMPSPPQSPFPEDTVNHGSHCSFSKVSSVSWVSSTQSSVLTSRVKDSPTAALAVSCQKERTPSSDRDRKSDQLHMSGPSRKRHVSSSSNSEEDEKEKRKKSKTRGQRSPRMKPRKLFKSSTRPHGQVENWGDESSLDEEESQPKDMTFKLTKERIREEYQNISGSVAEVSAEGEVSRVMSSSHTMSSSHWEAEAGDGDMDEDFELPKLAVNQSNMYKQFSSELKKKFQSRHNMVEVYNKQSLKTVQQHVSCLNTQVAKYRTQKLEQVQKVLMEEIHKLEQDDTVLKSMEKDLTMYWKKQSVAFHSYQEKGATRNEALKNALQSNVCHSVEYEERIFTSQMCMIRNDMKSVQDRLLSEMQEGEIQSVKRGLHALFFP